MDAYKTLAMAETLDVAGGAINQMKIGNHGTGDGDSQLRWYPALQSLWQRKLDEVIALSKASCGISPDGDWQPVGQGTREWQRLQSRSDRAYNELAAIEDAIARVDHGTYGLCADCDRVMPDEWLAVEPQALYCSECALRLVPSGPARTRSAGQSSHVPQQPRGESGRRPRKSPRPASSATLRMQPV